MDNKIVRAITSVTCVMLLVKAIAMLRSILQARLFGVGPDIDAFTLANNYSISLFTTGCYALCVAAIPILSQQLLKGRQACYDRANRLISNTMVLSLGLTGLLVVLGKTGLVGNVLGVSEQAALFRFCFLVLLPALPVIALTYLLLALFQSMGHFTLQGSLSLLYNIFLCAVLVLMGDRLDLRTFAVLTSACWLLQLAMTVPCIKKEGYRFRFDLGLRQREYWSFLRTGMMTMYNSSLFLLCYLINTRFAAAAAEGTISSFFYADKLYEPLTTAIIYSVSIVMFPKFSQKYVQMSVKEYRQYVVYILKNSMLLLLPLSLLFSAFGTSVIRVLFEGDGFTAGDSLLCGAIFSMYALGMVGFFILDLLTKAYYAMGKTLVPIMISSLVLVVCGSANVLFLHFAPDKPELLALGTSLGFLVVGAAAYLAFARKGNAKIPRKQLFWGVVFSLCLGGSARFIYVKFIADTISKGWMVLQCVGVGIAGMLLYLILMGPMVPTYEIIRKLWKGKKL